MKAITITIGLVILIFKVLFFESHATQPCMAPTEEWFAENIIKKSDLVIHAQVLDYSDVEFSAKVGKWTDVKIISIINGRYEGKEMLIRGWQANDDPFYNYERKKSELVLWLKRTGRGYQLTDESWKRCVPAMWNVTGKDKIYSILTNKVVKKDDVVNLISKYKP